MKSRLTDARIALVVFGICLFLYSATLTPGLSYASPDGNELTTVAATLGLAHPTGYPFVTWLGFLFARLLPFGDVALSTTASAFPIPIGGAPNLIGTIQRYGDNTLTLNTAQGSRTITINPQTIVRRESEPAQFADLRPGVAVAVWGDPGDNGRALVARVIVIVTQK